MTIKSKWLQSETDEARLDKADIQWEWMDRIQLADIDITGSLQNNARMGKSIDAENLENIKEGLKNGDKLPGVIVRRKPHTRKLQILVGNHRTSATSKLDRLTIGGYIVTCTDEQADLYTRSDNRRHGLVQTEKEAFVHIDQALKVYPDRSAASLAKMFNVKPEKVQAHVLTSRLRTKLETEFKVKTDKMAHKTLLCLNTVRQNENILHDAAQTTVTYAMTTDDIEAMCKQIKGQKSEKGQQITLDGWKNILKSQGTIKKTPKTMSKRKLLNALHSPANGLLAVLTKGGKDGVPITGINQIQLNKNDAKIILDDWKEIQKRMQPIIKECQKFTNSKKK